jgi:hypothetical protein
MTTIWSRRKWFRLVPVLLLLSWVVNATLSVASDLCDPKVVKRILDTAPEESVESVHFILVLDLLHRLDDKAFRDSWNRIARETLDVVDDNVTGGERVTIHKWTSAMSWRELSDAEIAAAVKALDNCRGPDGKLFHGIVFKPGKDDNSSALVVNLAKGNRGHFFEAVATDYLIRNGSVDRSKVRAMGRRLFGQNGYVVEGDLVEEIFPNQYRYFDFKAKGAEPEIDRLAKIEEGIGDGLIFEFNFVLEDGYSPSPEWWDALEAVNARLKANKLPEIEVMSGGPFP